MRRQVLLPLLVFGLLAIMAIVIPVGQSVSQSRTQELTLSRKASMDYIVRIAQRTNGLATDTSLQQYVSRHHELYGESVLVVDASGAVVAQVGELELGQDDVDLAVRAAARNIPQWGLPSVTPWTATRAIVAQPVHGDGELSAGVAVLSLNVEGARRDVLVAWVTLVGVGIVLLIGLVMLALGWTRSVLRPVQALDDAANSFLTRHGLHAVPVSGPPELRALASSFSRMAVGVDRTLTQQREFVADASHQLRNPLAAIRLRVDALRAEAHDDVDLVHVDHDVDQLERIVERMLVLANVEHRVAVVESGTDPIDDHDKPDAVSTAALVQPFMALHAEAGQDLVASGRAAVVDCDPADLEEIVATVLDNARKYAGRGATVFVDLHATEGGTSLIIQDDGPGLHETEYEQVGARFWRSLQHRDSAGTGLGLAIAQGLARVNGGTIAVSPAPQGGLQVTIRFTGRSG